MFSSSYSAIMHFHDPVLNRTAHLRLRTEQTWWSHPTQLSQTKYYFITDTNLSQCREHNVAMTRDDTFKFHLIPDLPRAEIDFPDPEGYYHFGILPTKYALEYKNKELKQTSYALLCGTWAVLLSDDLNFDSCVALSGASRDKLQIESIFYTVNPFFVKAMALLG